MDSDQESTNSSSSSSATVIQNILSKLGNIRLYPKFILTDKDFAQTNATHFNWNEIKFNYANGI